MPTNPPRPTLGSALDKLGGSRHLSGHVASEPTPTLASAQVSPVTTGNATRSASIRPGTFLKRLVSWMLLWTMVLLSIFFGWKLCTVLVIAFFGLLGQWEFYRAQEEKGHRVFRNSGVFFGALLFANSWYFLVYRPDQAGLVHAGVNLILALAAMGAFIRLVVRPEDHPAPITTAALTLLGLMYAPFLFNFVALLAFSPFAEHPEQNRLILIYLLAVTKFSDVGAYVIGSLLGRHKMVPRISPGKTWEGFAGAIATSLTISLALTYFARDLQFPLSYGIILGLLLPLISVLGDLAESMIKRDASLKDSGHTIPGIGGALDLIDSLLFTAPVLYLFLRVVGYVTV